MLFFENRFGAGASQDSVIRLLLNMDMLQVLKYLTLCIRYVVLSCSLYSTSSMLFTGCGWVVDGFTFS